MTLEMLRYLRTKLNLRRLSHASLWLTCLTTFWACLRLASTVPKSTTRPADLAPLVRLGSFRKIDGVLHVGLSRHKTNQDNSRVDWIPVGPRQDTLSVRRALRAFKAAWFRVTGRRPSRATFISSVAPGKTFTRSTFLASLNKLLRGRFRVRVRGHSFRRGFALCYIRAGLPILGLKRHGLWKSDAVLGYLDDAPRPTHPVTLIN